MSRLFSIFLLMHCLHSAQANAPDVIDVEILDLDFTIHRFKPDDGAASGHLVLYISPGYGNSERAFELADKLRARGIETWHVDLADNLFLPRSTHTLRSLDGMYVDHLVRKANSITGKQITLMSRSYGALPVLHGAHRWQQHHGALREPYLTGAILFSPELYSEVPALGLPPRYMPIARATTIPLMIYQAGKRGNRWQLDSVVEQLEQGGASVTVRLLPGVTGVFYHEDTEPETLAVNASLPDEIPGIIRMLDAVPTPLRAAALESFKPAPAPLDLGLKPFAGNFSPPPLTLPDIDGKLVQREDYSGKVTVVNFWASWCSPCVEEIPALNKLRNRMASMPFELISVNYAEDADKVREFMQMVQVDYPVLLDESGRVSASWQVLVYPATYVIGHDGRIAYGVNGAIHWDSDQVVARLRQLMPDER